MTKTANYPKRLIEVDLPIKRISAHARRENLFVTDIFLLYIFGGRGDL